MPTKGLPSRPNLSYLKAQAKELLRMQRLQTLDACQRIREFHPHFREAEDATISTSAFKLSDAQFTIAREYGFGSWPRLKAYIESARHQDLQLPHHRRIADPDFRHAVELIDAGNAVALRTHLAAHPAVVLQRVTFEGGNYFRNPSLLEFIAENPARHGKLPVGIVEIAGVILDAGARDDKKALNSALDLVASSSVARESGKQIALLNVLCDYGADPDAGLRSALLYGEFASAGALIERGATVDLVAAAALGRTQAVRTTLSAATGESRQMALSLGAQFGHAEIVRMLLASGADPNRYGPVGGHSHATPLHQAALAGHETVVRALVEHGAMVGIEDILYHATAAGWAEHAGHSAIAEYLKNEHSQKGALRD